MKAVLARTDWLWAAALVLVPVTAQALDTSYLLELEGTAFVSDKLDPSKFDNDVSASFVPEFQSIFNQGDSVFTFSPFGRWARRDKDRRHADIRELNLLHVYGDWEYLAGVSSVFWGVAESSHLVDIINQTDYLEGIDGEDKLGQPMLRTTRSFDQSALSFFILPGFRKREFRSPDSPLALPFLVDDHPEYESGSGDRHIDLAARYSGYKGSVDYGISWFHGTSRDPDYIPSSVPGTVIPFYPQIDQFGIDIQLTLDAWLWKLEAIRQERVSGGYTAYVGGFEYTFYNLGDGLYDLGVLLEHNYDSRNDPSMHYLQNDLFWGTRFGFNDTESSELLAGLIQDLDDQSLSLRIEANRRVFENSRINLEAQFFSNTDPDSFAYHLRHSDFIQLSLEIFF